jgi:choline kinase
VKSPNRAIILAAGQGKRLLPLTEARPKCLIELSGKSLLAWQLERLQAAGVEEAVIVTGFRADQVEAEVARLGLDMPVRLAFNPFYTVSDNTASCWIVREDFDRDVLVLNGDTLFGPGVAEKLLDCAEADITVTIDRKPSYDADDMKVLTEGEKLRAIGKTIEAYDAESIGFLRFTKAGAARFRGRRGGRAVAPRGPAPLVPLGDRRAGPQGRRRPRLLHRGLEWGEMDFPPTSRTSTGCRPTGPDELS